MKVRSSFICCAPLLIAITLVGGLPAQEKAKPEPQAPASANAPAVFKTTTRLVVVDVVATDGKGRPVTDLQAADFTVQENGKPQQVRSFSLQQPVETRSEPSRVRNQEMPPNVFTNLPRYQVKGVWNILLMDFMNSQVLSQADLHQQLIKVLEKLPDEPLAVYVLTNKLYLLQDFSTDREALRQLVLHLKNNISPNLDNAKGGHEMDRYPPGYIDSMPSLAMRASVLRMEANTTAAKTETRLRDTVDALNKIVNNVAALPGRKNLIWVSQAFPLTIEPGTTVKGFDSATGHEIDINVPVSANGLLDSQVAIYPVDPSGVHMYDLYDPAGHGTDALGRKESNIGIKNTESDLSIANSMTHASVNELAERTGGRAFYNLNDIGDAIIQSMRDGSTYYTLAYYPSDRNWDGKFRHIAVKVNRGGIRLRHRSGYFAIDPHVMVGTGKRRAEVDRVFHQALEIDAPVSTSLLFSAQVIAPSAPQNHNVTVNFQLEPGALSTETSSDGLQHLSVECAVQAFDESGKAVTGAGNTMAGALKPEAYEKVARQGLPCRQVVELPPGKYSLRLGVRDNLNGRIGTANANVIVLETPKAN
jgi:VWFA-related protein